MSRIGRFVAYLQEHQWLETVDIREWSVRTARYVKPGLYEFTMPEAEWRNVERMTSTQGTTYFMSRPIEIPDEWGPDEVAFVFRAGAGEGLLRVNGEPYHGLDRNHWFVPLAVERLGRRLALDIELFDPIPEPLDPLNRQAVIQPPIGGIESRLARVNKPVQSLLHATQAADQAARLLPEGDMRRIRTERALAAAMDALYGGSPELLKDGEAVAAAERRLADAVREAARDGFAGTMHMVGQSHIDVAWLWPVRETVRKVSRTFSTVMTLMERYPDFKYSQSQPQLYAFVKEHYPELFDKIKARVAEGRWELVGGMWVEPDLNIPNGESLVRQMLYGQRFYLEEFGKRSYIEWLPDTFGYCASLPQLLKQTGIEYFMTTKLGWNDTNKFPYDLFRWVGIDGTSIIAYQNHGLNEHARPKDIHEHWASFGQKDVHDELMLLYGHGDGGGGVTHEMIEYVRRADLMPGLPAARFAAAADFFGEIGRRKPKLPEWHGDLYLELHRGTYTTHARNKRSNRKAEVLFREAELWSRLAFPDGEGGREEELRDGWKLLLLNQFHDIIPGTSIPEVYVTSGEQYAEIFNLGKDVLHHALRSLASRISTDAGDGKPYLVFNSLGWERDEIVSIEGGGELIGLAAYDELGPLTCAAVPGEEGACVLSVRVPAIPAFGWKTIWLREAVPAEPGTGEGGAAERAAAELAAARQAGGEAGAARPTSAIGTGMESAAEASTAVDRPGQERPAVPACWETPFYTLRFNGKGEIVGWFDKQESRELIPAEGKANELQLFHDRPTYWDAWDIDPRFEEQRAGEAVLIGSEAIRQAGLFDILRFRWRLNESEIKQDIVLYHHRRRVDFKTAVKWNESHKLLKVAFPVEMMSAKATYEIPFGSLERPAHRNTSWEQAQFEVCGHRFADLSEAGYGASLLNDCKYGYDIKNGVMRLSLLRAPKWPDSGADQGEHAFTYSLYPHKGGWREAGVVREAAGLNDPVRLLEASLRQGDLPAKHALIGFAGRNVVLETVKRSEDGEATILRFYESAGGRETVTVRWPDGDIEAAEVNLLEEGNREIESPNGTFSLTFKPYEVRTVKLARRKIRQ